MKEKLFLALLLIVSGCAVNVCPENLDLGENKSLSYEERPDTGVMTNLFDHSVSEGGEVYELKVYQQEETYYVQYNPVRSFSESWYGPYNSSPLLEMECSDNN